MENNKTEEMKQQHPNNGAISTASTLQWYPEDAQVIIKEREGHSWYKLAPDQIKVELYVRVIKSD